MCIRDRAHLESSLEALKLWDEENPPQLQSIAEYDHGGRYALEMVFDLGDVPREHWHEKAALLGRFFGPGLEASLEDGEADLLTVQLRQPCP